MLDDAYLVWFSAESECERALRAWSPRSDAQRAAAYFAYRAALDREEAAARHLERAWCIAEPCDSRLVQSTESVVE